MKTNNTIYTIGHSIHRMEVFIEMLQSFGITYLADIRRYAVSKRHPQFTKETLSNSLREASIHYAHYVDLGARLDTNVYPNYMSYMQSEAFKTAIEQLQAQANHQKVAYMCAEANWQQCHRVHVSTYLQKLGWQVLHITAKDAATPHPLEILKQGKLF